MFVYDLAHKQLHNTLVFICNMEVSVFRLVGQRLAPPVTFRVDNVWYALSRNFQFLIILWKHNEELSMVYPKLCNWYIVSTYIANIDLCICCHYTGSTGSSWNKFTLQTSWHIWPNILLYSALSKWFFSWQTLTDRFLECSGIYMSICYICNFDPVQFHFQLSSIFVFTMMEAMMLI